MLSNIADTVNKHTMTMAEIKFILEIFRTKQLRTKYKDFYLALCISDEYIWIKGASINYVDKGPNVNDTRYNIVSRYVS